MESRFALNNLKNLVLSGGGLLGISYIGLLKYLEEHNIISQIKTITGCSAGAIFGTFIAIGYTSAELDKIAKNMIFKDYVKINAESLLNFPKTKGFESAIILTQFIKDRIKDKTGSPDITFQELYDKYNINLQIGVVNLTKQQFEIFNRNTKPNLAVGNAIRASIAIPFVFEPLPVDGDLYCDGGLVENLPIEYISSFPDTITPPDITPDTEKSNDNKEQENVLNTLGVFLVSKVSPLDASNYQSATISQYFSALMHTLSMTYYCRKKDMEKDKNYKVILFEIPCDIMTFIKINATIDDIENIINIAYNTCKKELVNT